ncbi:hypothetical protein HPB48_010360 [Haemaphysalis longicornis]|uniref:Uncharacterized protein n=1 Tax=Haemaphysalis longicornis TaxID=44386 RepID=A0A9J6G9M2_HAELO|nr:hypothetical protein HPB48_010360 [Haemaphysalis longicornis]
MQMRRMQPSPSRGVVFAAAAAAAARSEWSSTRGYAADPRSALALLPRAASSSFPLFQPVYLRHVFIFPLSAPEIRPRGRRPASSSLIPVHSPFFLFFTPSRTVFPYPASLSSALSPCVPCSLLLRHSRQNKQEASSVLPLRPPACLPSPPSHNGPVDLHHTAFFSFCLSCIKRARRRRPGRLLFPLFPISGPRMPPPRFPSRAPAAIDKFSTFPTVIRPGEEAVRGFTSGQERGAATHIIPAVPFSFPASLGTLLSRRISFALLGNSLPLRSRYKRALLCRFRFRLERRVLNARPDAHRLSLLPIPLFLLFFSFFGSVRSLPCSISSSQAPADLPLFLSPLSPVRTVRILARSSQSRVADEVVSPLPPQKKQKRNKGQKEGNEAGNFELRYKEMERAKSKRAEEKGKREGAVLSPLLFLSGSDDERNDRPEEGGE